jgi:hypothetical protein
MHRRAYPELKNCGPVVPLQVSRGSPPEDTLTITKTVSPASGIQGTVFTFTIVLDPGLEPVNSLVVLNDPIPPQLTNAQLLTTFGGRCGEGGATLLQLIHSAQKNLL